MTPTGSGLSRLQLYHRHNSRHSTMVPREHSLLAGVMTLVSSRGLCPLLRLWRPSSSWTSCSSKTHARPLLAYFLPSQLSHLLWLCHRIDTKVTDRVILIVDRLLSTRIHLNDIRYSVMLVDWDSAKHKGMQNPST